MKDAEIIRGLEYGICPSSERCGGCCYQGVPYTDQLKNKEGEVRGALRMNGVDPALLSGIEPSPCIYRYRNKMEYTFGNEVKDGPTILGLHAKKSFISIVPVDSCRLVPEDFNTVLKATLSFVTEKGYTHYHKKTHQGLMRSLVIRRGVRTGQLIINIVTSSDGYFDEQGYIDMIMSTRLDAKVEGLIHTINDNKADALIADEVRVLSGRDWYEEEILGLRFKVGAFSFFQTNVEAAERLYKDAIGLIDGLEGKTVYDLYCGTGTMTQAMALKAKKAIGVEIIEEAVNTAKVSAKLNGLSNCEFICGDVGKVLDDITEKPDVIMVDPPRAGIMPKAMLKILSYGVDQIVYISCSARSLAANLHTAQMIGYKVSSIKAYDNFSFTKHVECIALLERIR